uniref:Uncharacterized protein n=1 Tax=Meloidogyne floridensis TaxID=298350 RepID=A0A915NYT2_9BILA
MTTTTKKVPIDGNLYSQFTAHVKTFPTIETVKSTKKQQQKPGPVSQNLTRAERQPNFSGLALSQCIGLLINLELLTIFSFENYVNIYGLINKTNGFLESPLKENVIFPIFTIQLGTNDTMFAKLIFMNGTEKDYSQSAKFNIELNEAISLLGLDMDIHSDEKMKYMSFPEPPCYVYFMFNGKHVELDRPCDTFSNKQNFVTNRIEIRTYLSSLACNDKEANDERNAGIKKFYEICKYPTDNKSQIREYLKNNPKSNYAKSCYKNTNNQQEKHGIEFRISATRIGFNKTFDDYWITFGVNVSIGFSFSDQTIEFGKIIKVKGIIKSYYGPRILGLLNMEENHVLLLSLQLGNSENSFAILTDEMNGYVYNFERYIHSNIESQNIHEIAKTGGALALIGPDINMNGELLLDTHFKVNIASEKSCTGLIELTLNNALLDKQFSCYKRPLTQCDEIGLEEYNKLKTAFAELLDLYKQCPCDDEPRPKTITDERLIVPAKSRNKRSIQNSSLLKSHNVAGLVDGCENTTFIESDDIVLYPEDVARKIKNQRK